MAISIPTAVTGKREEPNHSTPEQNQCSISTGEMDKKLWFKYEASRKDICIEGLMSYAAVFRGEVYGGDWIMRTSD